MKALEGKKCVSVCFAFGVVWLFAVFCMES